MGKLTQILNALNARLDTLIFRMYVYIVLRGVRRTPINKGEELVHSSTIQQLEKDMEPVVKTMEERGLNVDLEALNKMITETEDNKLTIEKDLKETLGIQYNINFNSTRDVAELLKTKLDVTPEYTQSGRYSTNRRYLRGLHNPITNKIIKYRDYERLLSTLKSMREYTDGNTKKMHCTFVHTCPSGRLYAKNYNVQGIPEEARKVVVAERGYTFLLADYDTFELRILSALAHDTYFKTCWEQGLDLHCKVVSDMKNIPYEDITAGERKAGKVLNFGLSYGQEPGGLARNLNCSVEAARKLMAQYKSKIPEIEKFKKESVWKARKLGYCETYYGRKRLLPGLLSPDTRTRKQAERRVINTMIQGTGADIVKFALVRLHKVGFYIDTMLHDGILISFPDSLLEDGVNHVKRIMETEINGLEFTVTCKTGKTWADCY